MVLLSLLQPSAADFSGVAGCFEGEIRLSRVSRHGGKPETCLLQSRTLGGGDLVVTSLALPDESHALPFRQQLDRSDIDLRVGFFVQVKDAKVLAALLEDSLDRWRNPHLLPG